MYAEGKVRSLDLKFPEARCGSGRMTPLRLENKLVRKNDDFQLILATVLSSTRDP